MKIFRYSLFLLVLLPAFDFESFADEPQVWQLPRFLNEISALAQGDDGRIFTLNDEKAIVYEFDPITGVVTQKLKIVRKNGKVIKRDFEGLAFAGKHIYLVTSKGKLYRGLAKDLDKNSTIRKDVVDTGLSKICEVEGLSGYQGALYFVCKTKYRKQDKGELLVFRYDPETDETIEFIRAKHSDLGWKKLNPSGIDVSDKGILVVAARQALLLRLDIEGNFIRALKLNKHNHPQAEGVLLTSSGKILIANEGNKNGGFISIFSPQVDEP